MEWPQGRQEQPPPMEKSSMGINNITGGRKQQHLGTALANFCPLRSLEIPDSPWSQNWVISNSTEQQPNTETQNGFGGEAP